MQRYAEGDRLLVVAGGSGAGWILPFIELFHRRESIAADEENGQDSTEGEEKVTQPNRPQSERSLSGPLSMRVILATRDTSSRIWFLKTVGELLSKYPTPHPSFDIDVQVYLTGEAEQDAHTPQKVSNVTISGVSALSSENINVKAGGHETTVPGKELFGRPDLPLLVRDEGTLAAEVSQSLSVFVCGPTTMQNDVRNAVADENLKILKGSKSSGVYLHSEHFSWT